MAKDLNTERETQKQRDNIETCTLRDTLKHICIQREPHTQRHRHTHRDPQIHTHSESKTQTERVTHTERETQTH